VCLQSECDSALHFKIAVEINCDCCYSVCHHYKREVTLVIICSLLDDFYNGFVRVFALAVCWTLRLSRTWCGTRLIRFTAIWTKSSSTGCISTKGCYSSVHEKHTAIHTHFFNRYFPGKPRLASCLLDSQSLVILILGILTRQAKTLHMVLQVYLHQLPSRGALKQKFLKAGSVPVAQPTESKHLCNFRKCTPILTIFSLLEQEIYGA